MVILALHHVRIRNMQNVHLCKILLGCCFVPDVCKALTHQWEKERNKDRRDAMTDT